MQPNPTKGAIQLVLEPERTATYQLFIQNALGQTVSQRSLAIHSGLNTIDLNMNDYAAGIYWLVIDDGQQQVTKKVVKD